MSINTPQSSNWNTIYIGSQDVIKLKSAYASASTAAAKANIIKDIAKPSVAVKAVAGTVASNAYVYLEDLNTEVNSYFKNTGTTQVTLVAADLLSHEALSKKLSFWSAEIPFVQTQGDLGSESTVIESTLFNKAYKIKSQGQIDGGSLDAEMIYVPGNDIVIWMRAQHVASKGVSICLRYKGTKNATDTDSHFVAFDSFVSSNDRKSPFDGYSMSSIVFPCNGEQYEADGALGTARWG